ncbi:hypothetical protein K439DRAFT_1364321, partial [Ramaria rubella]
LTKYDIPPENIYNADEKGLQLGGGRKNLNCQFFFKAGIKQCYIIHLYLLTLVMIIECKGNSMLTIVEFLLYINFYVLLSQVLNNRTSITTSPSSWTDNNLYQVWFKKVFLLHAASRNTSGKHILLITNGHGSHEHLDIIMLDFKHKVLLYSLSPYTTQSQPLDVGVFGPVQNVWAHQCQIAAIWGSPISTKMVIQEYLAVHNETMTTRLIKSAFRHTGIWPFNASLFTLLDFAPVMLTSTHSLGPPSYPTHFPSSPDMAQTTDGVSLASWESTESSESMAGNHSDEDMAKARFDEMEFSNHDSASWDDESGSDNESEPSILASGPPDPTLPSS